MTGQKAMMVIHSQPLKSIQSQRLLSFMLVALICHGCGSLGGFGRQTKAEDDPASTRPSWRGPLEGKVSLASHSQESLNGTAAMREFNEAEALFEAGDYKNAEEKFQTIASRFEADDTGQYQKRTIKNFFKPLEERQLDYAANPLHEDSLYYVAECKFATKAYPGAQDVYQQILKVHPGTRHLNKISHRLFEIAMIWLNIEPIKNEDIKLASFSTEGAAPRPEVNSSKDWDPPSFFSFTDRSRPITDTQGRALQALKSIWMNDPTGELADDAIMLSGSHYLRVGRYNEAAEMFRILRDEYPNSPHYKEAYLLGAHVTQASYQGAEYDGTPLVNSRQLRQTALQAFSMELSAEQKARLQNELKQIDEAVVAREFKQIELYMKKGKYDAVEIYCHDMINTYPESIYSRRAQQILTALPELRSGSQWLAPWSAREVISQVSSDRPAQVAAPAQQTAPAPTEPQEKGSSLFRLPGLPKLKPVPLPKLPTWGGSGEEPLEDPFNPPVSSEPASPPVKQTSGKATVNFN